MSQQLTQLFNEFVKKSEDDLAGIDKQYSVDESKDEECAKYVEKLQIYEKFTDGLKDKSEHYLKVIGQLDDGLANLDELSSTRPLKDDISKDLDFVRNCLEKRAECEEVALDSLAKLEGIVKSMLEKNKRLKSDESEAEGIASNVILNLNDGNKKIKDIIKRNKDTMEFLGSKDVSGDEDSIPSEYESQLSSLRNQLDEKTKVINHLTNQIKNSGSTSRRSHFENSDNSMNGTQSRFQHPQRSRSEMSLSETEKYDNDKLQLFKNAYKEMALILKEKYKQIRDQNDSIAELTRKLDEYEKEKKLEMAEESTPSTEETADGEKMKLMDEDAELKPKDTSTSSTESDDGETMGLLDEDATLKPKSQEDGNNLKHIEKILARKFVLQETHIKTLRDERQHLMKLNNEMLNTIAICKEELSKYNIE